MSRRPHTTWLEESKKEYFKCLSVRNFFPIILYHQCEKCGDEFCRQPMYECSEPSIYFSWKRYYHGCSHCFQNKKEFLEYLQNNEIILTEKDFEKDSKKLFF